MNNKNYILVDRSAIATIVNTLLKIDKVDGFQNMERLVESTRNLVNILQKSPDVNISQEEKESAGPELQAAAEAAKAEEESRNK